MWLASRRPMSKLGKIKVPINLQAPYFNMAEKWLDEKVIKSIIWGLWPTVPQTPSLKKCIDRKKVPKKFGFRSDLLSPLDKV